MGQSKIGPYNSEKSFTIGKFNLDRQFTFSESTNYELVHKAINFSNIHLMIHDCLFINGHFLSNCKFTFSVSYNLKEIKQILQKENKMMLFQHEFERISQDIRFKNNTYKQKTEIQEVSISDLYREISITNENMPILDSFGTTNNSVNQINQRGRKSKPSQFVNSSAEEDFTDNDDRSKSRSASPFAMKQSSENKQKSSLIIKKNFPSDSESGIEQRLEEEIKSFSKIIKDKSNILSKEQFLEPSLQQNTNNSEDYQQEQEIVNQVNSDLQNLKSRIESNIGPSYKETSNFQYTSNYQKLLKQQNQPQLQNNTSNQSTKQQKQTLFQQQQELLQLQQQQAISIVQTQTQPKPQQKTDPVKPNQIKSISIQINNRIQTPSQNSQIYKPIVSNKYQVSSPETSNSSVYKPPWGQNQASILSQKSSDESGDGKQKYQQQLSKKQQQPTNIKIDFNQKSSYIKK